MRSLHCSIPLRPSTRPSVAGLAIVSEKLGTPGAALRVAELAGELMA